MTRAEASLARRGRRRSASASEQDGARDANALSLTALSRLLSPAPQLSSAVEDRREWHPDPDQGALTVGGRWARVVVHQRPLVVRSQRVSGWIGGRGFPVGLQVPVGVRFESPFKVMTCIRRKVRRAVIFARNKAGKGVKRRKPRRNWRSNVVC